MTENDPTAGVDINKARSMTTWRTELRENVDGDKAIGVERVREQTQALGSIGRATPCCDAPGGDDEHTPDCAMNRPHGTVDDVNDWLRRELKGD